MKASKVASVVAALIASDAKPTEQQILAAILAADKKGKDGLGPEEIEKNDKAKDEKDKDDPESTNDEEMDDDKAKDADMEDMDAEDDVQPKESATPNKGANAGKEPAKDKKGMDAAIKLAIDARDALHTARRDVETVLGVVAYDSAAEVYKAALVKLGVDTAGIHESAYPALFKLARDKAEATTPVMASDAATVQTMAKLIPGYDRLK